MTREFKCCDVLCERAKLLSGDLNFLRRGDVHPLTHLNSRHNENSIIEALILLQSLVWLPFGIQFLDERQSDLWNPISNLRSKKHLT